MVKQVLQKPNGIDTDRVRRMMPEVSQDPAKGKVKFQVATSWKEGPRCETSVTAWEIGGKRIGRGFTIPIDEPPELFGTDTAPNPQEMLLAAMNACMLAGYVTGCSLKGIELESLTIETEGELDLRGFFGIDKSVKPGYDEIRYTVRIKGDGTPQQFEEIHDTVMATSPNYFNMANPIMLNPQLVVE